VISKQQIKHIRSLQQKKYRNDLNLYVIEGIKMVIEAIRQIPQEIEYICLTTKYLNQVKQELIKHKIQLNETSSEDFRKISSLITPQEILAVIKKPGIANPTSIAFDDICLALDGIRDPGNMGTIIRLADWFGISQIVCSPDTVDCYNPKVVQASMGAIFRVKLTYTELAKWLVDVKSKKGANVYCTSLNGDNLYASVLKKPAIMVLGNEAKGISDDVSQLADKNLFIPNQSNFPDKTESLNVSIAAAIVCAEFTRQFAYERTRK
jgi:TrmH family RNA methyltransferase